MFRFHHFTSLTTRKSTKRFRYAVAAAVALWTSGGLLASASPAHIVPPPAQLDAHDVAFASTSGSRIHAWFSRGQPGAGAVLLLHGVGENRMSMLGRASFLHAAGFTVLAPDFQAHGESPGAHPTFGALESLDAAAAMTFLRTTGTRRTHWCDRCVDGRRRNVAISLDAIALCLRSGTLEYRGSHTR